ncbi:MAG TPA: SDR family NAD(P)-dependent oxidoreductase [Jiangellales bacterium]|nr:SDR family NAD(P)-dependent oxidoreductase [Jiangellales bacterium]
MTLTGKSAIVTGAGSGIGRAVALALAAEGASIAAVDVDPAGASATAAAIQAAGGRALALQADVSTDDECRRVVDQTVQTFGPVNVLVNNAGIIRRADVIGTSVEDWDRVMAVNVRSVFLMCKYTVPVMSAAGGGSIVNIGSGWGLKGGGNAVSYCASKAAVVNMTRAMAIDHGAAGIRVNSVNPGDTDTPMLREEARQLNEDHALFLADAGDRPLRRMGRPEEIAAAVIWLAGDSSSYVTGAALVVDGGGLA